MHLLFDLDGTIMDSAEGIINALNHTLVTLGEEPRDPQSLTRFIGPSLKVIFTEVLNTSCAAAIDEAIVTYREYYFTRGYKESKPYEGIDQTLSCLQDKAQTIRICTARRRDIATTIIKHFGLDAYFDDIHGCDLDGTKTEIIKGLLADGTIARPAFMIGDRGGDIAAAHNAGIGSIAVRYGFGSLAELTNAKPTHIVDCHEELLAIVAGAA